VGSQACIDRQFSVTDFWDRVRFYDAHHTITLGTMHMYLWGAPERVDDAENPLRTQFMTPMPADLVEPWCARFGVETLLGGYGQSEVMGATQYRHDDPVPPGSSGPPTPLVDVAVLDEDDVAVGPGETGEICVRPRQPDVIFQGSWKMPDETIHSFRNLWHHTGDLGRFDDGGNLWFVDRKKDATRHKGRSISSFEVEHIARQHPSVLHVAAVGVRDPLLEAEDELMLFVVPNPGDTVDPLDLCRFIDANAPYFFVPRYVEVVDELPATPTGKVEKYKLRERGAGPNTWDRHVESDWQPTR
jgi:crotonobetaine/carnitine-CoA ligase